MNRQDFHSESLAEFLEHGSLEFVRVCMFFLPDGIEAEFVCIL